MAYIVEHQYSLFDRPSEPAPGEWVKVHGPELSFDQITQMVGKLIVMDKSTESHEWFEVVRMEKIIWNDGGRRLIYYDGTRQRGLVDERYFTKARSYCASRAYLLAGQCVPFPCNDCIFDKCGRCDHIESRDCYCINGSFQVIHRSAKCPQCGRDMEILQSDFGKDGGHCHNCGTNVIFNNQGNRPSAMDLWRRGELSGS